jgi:hypothetical protein
MSRLLILLLLGAQMTMSGEIFAQAITVLNPGFEDPAIKDGLWITRGGPDWGYGQYSAPLIWTENTSSAGVLTGIWNPDANIGYPDGNAYAGENAGWTISSQSTDIGLSQILADTLESQTEYVLDAQIGNPFFNQNSDDTANYRLELLAGGVLLDSVTGTSPASGQWENHGLSFDSGRSPAQLGELLEIRLISVRYTEGGGQGRSEVDFDEITLTSRSTAPVMVELDIKPGPSNNTVPLNGNGTLQMAILANDDFDVADVDIDSLLFGDPILVDGSATPLGVVSDKLRDLNHDGLDDLLVGFSISGLVEGGALDASSIEGRLTGELFDGTPIIGSDIVRMVPQNNGGGGSLSIATVPEPGSCVFALTALCLAVSRRRGLFVGKPC